MDTVHRICASSKTVTVFFIKKNLTQDIQTEKKIGVTETNVSDGRKFERV
jgi:hypothetical protein